MIASHFRMAALYHNIVADNAANTHILGRSVERNGTERPTTHDGAFPLRVTKVTERWRISTLACRVLKRIL